MSNTILNIAKLNPVKFYSQTLKYPDNYRSRPIDQFSFENQIRNFEEKVSYYQKWMHDDVINLQFETDFTDIKVQVVGDFEVIYKTMIPEVVSSTIINSPLTFQNVSITLDDLPAGRYVIRIALTVETGVKYDVSEPQEVCEVVENSSLIHYSNVTNDYDIAFDTDIVFQFRAEGGLSTEGFRPGNKRKVYEDQNLNSVRLSATPFRTEKMVIGGPGGVPKWVADLINRIFCCDYTTIDGDQYVRLEGDMEAKREDNYPMAGWSFDVREAKNTFSKNFRTMVLFGVLDYDGALLLDYDNNPILYK